MADGAHELLDARVDHAMERIEDVQDDVDDLAEKLDKTLGDKARRRLERINAVLEVVVVLLVAIEVAQGFALWLKH